MFLNIFTSIDEWTQRNMNFILSIKTLLVLVAGIFIGLVIAATFYAVILFASIKKKEKEIKEATINISDDEILAIVNEIKHQYVAETEGLPFNSRFDILKVRLSELVNRIASAYYPNSKYPMYELTIEETIMFMQYISTRIDKLFEKRILRQFKKISISQIFKILDTKKKIEQNKTVQTIKNSKTRKVSNTIIGTIKKFNPTYWIKKILIGSTVNFGTRKISLLVMDIVADETNKAYSKSIFQKEKDLEILEIEKTIESLEGDEIDV